MKMHICILLLLTFASFSLSKTVEYHFNIGWIFASPDGYGRPVIGVNGQFPLPIIEADRGDTIVVHTLNSLGNQTTSLHFHGQAQQGSSIYDGPVGVTQCSIPPGESFTYRFTAEPAGTFWYHSHDAGQYPDGLRGKMIIHDPQWEDGLNIDEQFYLSVSDWYHAETTHLIKDYLSVNNQQGLLPNLDSLLFNDTSAPTTLNVSPGKRYLFRLSCMSAMACGYIEFEAHNMTVVGVDGTQVHAQTTEALIICPGQRYDFILETQQIPRSSFRYYIELIPSTATANYGNPFRELYGTLAYSSNYQTLPVHEGWKSTFSIAKVLNDLLLTPLDKEPLLTHPTVHFSATLNQTYYTGIGTRMSIGSQPWVPPKVPTLYTALSIPGAGAKSNAATYGAGISPFIVQYGDVVEFVLTNPHPDPHPMHLHGHQFQVVARGFGTWDGNSNALPAVPVKRDTVVLPANSFVVLRWAATNPGVWFMHCHIDAHVMAGMAAVFIEAPDRLAGMMSIPVEGARLCKLGGLGYKGDCSGSCSGGGGGDANSCNTIFHSDMLSVAGNGTGGVNGDGGGDVYDVRC